MSKSGNFLAGLLSGAFVGAVVALLYAPEAGEITRSRLSYHISNYIDELTDLLAQLKKEKEQLMSDAKDRGKDVVDDVKGKMDELIKEVEVLIDSQKSKTTS